METTTVEVARHNGVPVSHRVGPPRGDAPTPPRRRWYTPLLAGDLVALWPAIVVAFLGVLGIAFVMSFHGLFVFGDQVMKWAIGLCIIGPIGLDVFSLVGLIATFLTRDAPWRIRIYCWLAFLSTVMVSIAGNAVSAYAVLDRVAERRGEDFIWGYQQVSTIVGAAFWPALSAVALHVLIVVRRHLDERRDKIRKVSDDAQRAADAEQVLRARAIEMAAGGATASAILAALELDESKRRTVERWTEPIRKALAEARNGGPAKAATPTARTRSKES